MDYRLTPPELLEEIRKEFGTFFDPCPFPRPEGFDGLAVEWGEVSYVNPLFYRRGTSTQDGKKRGMSAWLRKAVEEWRKGKTIILLLPITHWNAPHDVSKRILEEAEPEIRPLKGIQFLAMEDGSRGGKNNNKALFILKGIKQEIK